MQNFILISLCSWTDWCESDSETHKTGFSRDGLNVSYHLFKPEDHVKTSSVWNVIIDHVDPEKERSLPDS